ncbi:hypothetical protein JCGZ_00534 [Jatropha curcas]|uniref:Uncharacterized protein n=1 Tax=Jatropha curcas TaxID=180498 RepID=A0A067LEP6_JATCU|nr:hypothetical protein JCGZ_00534 [Jatropha curcas]
MSDHTVNQFVASRLGLFGFTGGPGRGVTIKPRAVVHVVATKQSSLLTISEPFQEIVVDTQPMQVVEDLTNRLDDESEAYVEIEASDDEEEEDQIIMGTSEDEDQEEDEEEEEEADDDEDRNT